MERITIVNCAVLFVVVLWLGAVLSDTQSYDPDARRADGDKKSYLWFGPRLGRKRRTTPNGDEPYRSPELDRDQLAALMDNYQDIPWGIFFTNEGKRHTVNFTPRLGRDSGEDFTGDRWVDTEISGESLSQRSPPFAPRLGRHLSPYYHHLGTDADKLQKMSLGR